MQLVELRIAENEAVVGVPQHEGLGNRLDGVVKARVGFRGPLLEAALLRHVDGDADQMARGVVRVVHEFGAGAQPHPFAGRAADAEFVIEQRGLGGGELFGERVEILVVGMDHRIDFAERQELVLTLVAEKLIHGIRPVEPTASDIPIPQSATAAVQRGIDPVADLLADFVRRAGAIRLHHIRNADPEQHDDRGGEQRHMPDGARPPAGQNAGQGLQQGDLPGRCGKRAHGGDAVDAAREPDRHDAGAVGEGRQGLRFAEKVDQRFGNGHGRRVNSQHLAGRVDEHERAALRQSARRHAAHERVELGRRRIAIHRRRMKAKLGSRQRRDDVDIRDGVAERALAAFAHLNPRACRERQEKEGEQRRNGQPQQGLVLFKSSIGGVRVGSRYPQDRTRACGNARGRCPRHALSSGILVVLIRKDVPHLSESPSIESRARDLSSRDSA